MLLCQACQAAGSVTFPCKIFTSTFYSRYMTWTLKARHLGIMNREDRLKHALQWRRILHYALLPEDICPGARKTARHPAIMCYSLVFSAAADLLNRLRPSGTWQNLKPFPSGRYTEFIPISQDSISFVDRQLLPISQQGKGDYILLLTACCLTSAV